MSPHVISGVHLRCRDELFKLIEKRFHSGASGSTALLGNLAKSPRILSKPPRISSQGRNAGLVDGFVQIRTRTCSARS